MSATSVNTYADLSLDELFAEADRIGNKYQSDETPDWLKEVIASEVDADNEIPDWLKEAIASEVDALKG